MVPAPKVTEEAPRSGVKSLQSIEDLPRLLRTAIQFSPTRWRKTFAVFEIVAQLGSTSLIFSYITSSTVIGIFGGVYFAAISCMQCLAPDFSKGLFLEMLLEDENVSKKMNEELYKMLVSSFGFLTFIMMPICFYFFYIPFAYTASLGPSTFTITIVVATLGTLSNMFLSFFQLSAQLPERVSFVHIGKITLYLEKIRDVLLDDDLEDGMQVIKKLSTEQKKVENWIMAINSGISFFNTMYIFFSFTNCAFFLTMAAGGFGFGAMLAFSLFALFMWYHFSSSLYSVAKPNLVWEQQKVSLLNDPEVISAVLLKLKFTTESFESWLKKHNINSSRAFGTKITFEIMKKAAGALTTIFGTVLYLLLRDEFRR